VRHEKYVGVLSLAEQASKILAESGLVQKSGTVRDAPDERTIRYYQTEGLISPTDEKNGTASVFGYWHLLQVLVIKKLQSEHLPIRKIRDLINGRSERELERLLGTGEERKRQSGSNDEALHYLETLLLQSPPPEKSTPLFRRSASLPSPSPLRSVPPMAKPNAGRWERIEIDSGLELHLRDDYRPPDDEKGLDRLTKLIISKFGSRSQMPKKKGDS
jgi:DNA-binding transcriptional MerR regulator